MDCALESDRTARGDRSGGIPPGELVATAGFPGEVIRGASMDHEFRKMGHQVNQTNASPTLDALFQRIMARNRDGIALIHPLNKPRITGQPQLRLTYAQADRAISAMASHFIEAGLPTHSVIAVQLPNTVEFVLTVLAAH